MLMAERNALKARTCSECRQTIVADAKGIIAHYRKCATDANEAKYAALRPVDASEQQP